MKSFHAQYMAKTAAERMLVMNTAKESLRHISTSVLLNLTMIFDDIVRHVIELMNESGNVMSRDCNVMCGLKCLWSL